MINLFYHDTDSNLDVSLRDVRREHKQRIQQKRLARGQGSTISRREFEHRKRAKQIADKSRKMQRRFH